jgi:hypothetical protein
MRLLRERDGRFLEPGDGRVGLADVNTHLQDNLAARHGRPPGNGRCS